MSKAYFVTGTDTDVGKTLIAAGLLAAARKQGLSTLAIKPVAAGCEQTPEGLRNADARQLMAEMSEPLSYQQVNPVALQAAIAPHIAAAQSGQSIELQTLIQHCERVLSYSTDLALIEGAGGWRLPLNEDEYLSSLPQALAMPAILVVGMKLGCLNHALLTAEAIENDGVRLAGWVANCSGPLMGHFDANLATLQRTLKAPLLGVVPHLSAANAQPDAVAEYLDISCLI